MKRVFFIAMLALGVVATGSAQKKNVSAARNKALSVESPDFEGAKKAIEAALEDETTKDLAETWYVAGLVYQKIIDNDIYKAMMGGTQNPVLEGESAIKSHDYYLVAYDKDLQPNAKGKVKPKYTKQIRKAIINYYNQMILVNYGITAYNEQDFATAIRAFEVHTDIPKLAMFKNEDPYPFTLDSTYYQIRYYTAMAYERNGNSDSTLQIFEQIKDKGYEEIYINQHISDLYKERGDTANYLRTLKEGYSRFPKEFFFLGNLINYYIFSGQEELGIEYLDKAIEMDPTNAEYYNVKGSVMETLNKISDAEAAYDYAITLDGNSFKALNGKARMIYIRAAALEEKSVMARDMKAADMLQVEALKLFKEALPYFEQAAEQNPTEVDNLRTLRSVYYKLSRTDKAYMQKYDEINAKIKAL